MNTVSLVILLCGVSLGVLATPVAKHAQGDKKVVCYYGSWAVYRPGQGKFDVEQIDPTICTHLIYGFTGLSTDNKMIALDAYNDLEENWGRGAIKRFSKLKEQNANLKTLIAIGGWNEGSEKYSEMVKTAAGRRTFIDSVIPFIEQQNLDGLDLDWEYPTQREGAPEDRQNFALLVSELRAEFNPRGWLLTAAVGANELLIEEAYDVPSLSRDLDFINVMTYDYHGATFPNHSFTGHHSPLFVSEGVDTPEYVGFNSNHSIHTWLRLGAAPEKLILGMGSYGRGFVLANEADNKPYDLSTGPISAGPFTREPGYWGYNEICEKLQAEPGQWTTVVDPSYVAPYAYKGKDWIGYDDVASVTTKSLWAMELGLGGGMVWSVETDDFHGTCGEAFPLIKTIYRTMNGEIVTPPTRPPVTTDPTAPTEDPVTSAPGTTKPPPTGICSETGFVGDKEDCSVFYRCDFNGVDWDIIPFRCAAGTWFDPDIGSCNYPEAVENPACEQ